MALALRLGTVKHSPIFTMFTNKVEVKVSLIVTSFVLLYLRSMIVTSDKLYDIFYKEIFPVTFVRWFVLN